VRIMVNSFKVGDIAEIYLPPEFKHLKLSIPPNFADRIGTKVKIISIDKLDESHRYVGVYMGQDWGGHNCGEILDTSHGRYFYERPEDYTNDIVCLQDIRMLRILNKQLEFDFGE
jgi:hypothetical protein